MSQQQVSALVLSAVSIASHFGFLFPTLLPNLETLFHFLFTLLWSQRKQWTKGKRQCLEDSVCNRPSPYIQPQPRCWFCLVFIFPNSVVHTKWSYEFWFWLPWSVYRAVYAYLRSNAPRSHFLVPPKGFARLQGSCFLVIPELRKRGGLACGNQWSSSSQGSPERARLGAGLLGEQPGETPEKTTQGSPFTVLDLLLLL